MVRYDCFIAHSRADVWYEGAVSCPYSGMLRLESIWTRSKENIKDLLRRLSFRQSPLRNRLLLLGDLFLICVAVLGSFALRLEFGGLFFYYLPQALRMIILAALIKPLVYYLFGLYRRLWAYASIRELMLIVAAVTTASVMLSVAVIVMTYYQVQQENCIGFPRSVLVIDWMLSMILAGGLRFSSRLIAESRSAASEGTSDRRIESGPHRGSA